MRIAFIGLGNMGGPMASNLARDGYELSLFDLDTNKVEAVRSAGVAAGNDAISSAATAAEAVSRADIAFTSLPNPKIIESVALADQGIVAALPKGAVWIDLSTNNLECERRIRAAAEARGIDFLDAPVTGGIEGAAAGTLMIMVGGDSQVFARCKPVLEKIGNRVMHLGPHGAGYVAKISQVVLCYLNSVALSEALMLGVKGGVSAETMLGIIQESTGASYVANRYGPAILDGSYDPGFALGLAHKDMALTLELAASVGATLPMCEQVEAVYKKAVDKFGFDQNHLMAVKLLEEQNGTFLRST
ncbi:NAD(P)-dependent oxidoreductase [Mesorhizobium sp. M7A.F.Ce.TU.012.03.2.1]|uniref:NAD(P)-dependent oxidoreductase n=1 Tax=Mesorhizobium sp. M7A.F.Ce.TU.012.03.2.1 TaxID=2493681 RepID=UPI000FDADFEB|nr:NAD(P)-dependent oxidoreductase [Mesorhizobium sp. M7A.F.Ce.TU.012.03.2.1]AZV19300.1 NAD(P)-dependent oxidoreductase [Mesorhizobium sp. M7A.F.Ce.TU.012.03.2.1]